MKNSSSKSYRTSGLGKLFVVFILAFSAVFTRAEDVFVTAYKGTAGGTDVVPCPPTGGSCFPTAGVSTFGASSASASSASPIPVIPASARRVVYANSTIASWAVTPTDATYTGVTAGTTTFTSLQNIGVYKMYITRGSGTTTHSTNLVMSVTASGGALADTNGVGSASLSVPFTRSSPANQWIFIGYITNTIASPTVTFSYLSGAVDGTANRWNMDAVRFEFLDLCTGVANQLDVTGPLAAGQTFVNVTGTATNATNVVVYANGIAIGQTNSSGFLGGIVTVMTTPLAKDEIITAGQIKNGCSSQVPAIGPVVGGGANPKIKVLLGCWKNSTNAGPIGANSSAPGSGFPYFLKGSSLAGGFGTAPIPGEELLPGQCWQTVTFDPQTDTGVDQNSGAGVFNPDPWFSLESLVFSISDTDSGPYEIYVDQIKNGDTIVEDFESYAENTTNTFINPNAAATPSPASTYLSAPNSTRISANNAFDGTKSCRIQWQFANSSNLRWAKVLANGASGGKRYPQLNTTNKITIRYLVLPVGQTTNKLHFPTVPANQTKTTNETATFSVTAVGEGPFTYQWQYAGADLPGETLSSYSKSNVQLVDAGTYSVTVTGNGGAGCSANLTAKLTVTEFVAPPTITYTWNGSALQLNWTGTFNLESKTNLSQAAWTSVGVSTGPYNVPLTGSATFYRLHNP